MSVLVRSLVLLGFICGICGEAQCDTLYSVSIDTAPLIGHPAAPFYLGIGLVDGSGAGDANNTATLSNFNFNGGTEVGTPLLFGGASGSLSQGVSITDDFFFNLFEEEFSPGAQLSFNLLLTSNDDEGGTPDRLTLLILDDSGIPLPTLAPVGDYLIGADFGSSGPTLDLYGTDPNRSPSSGSPLTIPTPTVAALNPVPEPPTLVLVGGTTVTILLSIRLRLWGTYCSRPQIAQTIAASEPRSIPVAFKFRGGWSANKTIS
jgi:hypothetical protein